MAISNLAAIAAALSTNFAPDLNRLWNREAITLSNIPKVVGSHKSVFWTVSNSGAAAGSVAEGSDVQSTEFNIDDKLPMTLDRGIYRSAFGLSHTEIAVAESSKGSALAVMDLLAESMLGSATSLASLLNQDAILGTGTDGSGNKNLVGLLSTLQVATGTYAGKDRGTYTGLQANLLPTVGTLTAAVMRKAMSKIFSKTNEVPDFILCSPETARQYENIVEGFRRTIDFGTQIPNYRTSTLPQLPNVPRLFFGDVPVYMDKDWPDGYMVMGQWQHLEFNVLPYRAYGDAVSDRSEQLVRGSGDEFQPLDVPVKIYPLAKTGSSVKFAMECEVQLKIKRPNAFAVLSGITIA